MKLRPWMWLWIPLITGCQTKAVEDRQRLAADLQDAMRALRPWIGPSAQPYVDAVEPLIAALVAGEPIVPTVFAELRAREELLRMSLISAGRTPEQAESLLALLRITLRHIEAAVVPVTQGEVPLGH